MKEVIYQESEDIEEESRKDELGKDTSKLGLPNSISDLHLNQYCISTNK